MPMTAEQREDLKGVIGEGFHTAFRKATFCEQANTIWKAISEMPEEEWNEVLEFVMACAGPLVDEYLDKKP